MTGCIKSNFNNSLTHSSSSNSVWCGMESCFTGKVPPSPPATVCNASTLLHTTVLSVADRAGLWPGSPWTGLWFCSLLCWILPWCWPPCTRVCFWFLETYPGCAAWSASNALLTNSSLSVWTNCSVWERKGGNWKKLSWDDKTNENVSAVRA